MVLSGNMKRYIRRKHRLDKAFYIGYVRVTITICIKGNKEVFVNDKVYKIILIFLKEELKKEKIINWVYIFMPDHIHMVL